jgi:hypothetical protein
MTKDWSSEYVQLCEDCETRSERLSDWENTFIDSMQQQLANGRHPSPKQVETLEKVWEKATARG